MRNIKKRIKNSLLKRLIGNETLYLAKHSGGVHFQGSTIEGKSVRITNADGEIFEGVVIDYIYPDYNKPEENEIIVLDCPIRSDGYHYTSPVRFDIQNIKMAEII